MSIPPTIVAARIEAYLRHEITLGQLVDWAETQMLDGDPTSPAVRDALARLGLADVREFGLTWDDCETLLRSIGYKADIRVAAG